MENKNTVIGTKNPVGTVIYHAGTRVPEGYLMCDGSAISREVYANLFEVIGTIYGAGEGNVTFNLPDLRGEFIRGLDMERGIDEGRELGSFQNDAIRNIKGSMVFNADIDGQGAFSRAVFTNPGSRPSGGFHSIGSMEFDASRVVPTANENRPRNVALLVCIKY